MYILFLIIIGLILRLFNINKIEGLWNDEYVSWFVASTPFNNGFIEEILKQCHMPLYYFILKPFTSFDDIILRLTSVIPSIMSIYIMYLIGKEYSPKTAKIMALTTTVLPFLVYYSQEVRFYSCLFLFSSMLLLFLIRLLHSKKSLVGYIISSLLVIFTHILGCIYVFATTIYLIYQKRLLTKKLLIIFAFAFLTITPLIINIMQMIPSSQWWGKFSYTNLLFLITDYFSPILTNHINAPPVFIYNKDFIYNLYMILPSLLVIYAISKSIKKNIGLLLISLFVIFVTGLLALSGKLVFITKYTIEILPILILLFSLGIKDKFDNVILVMFLIIQLSAVFMPFYSTKVFRGEGNKLVSDILNNTKQDVILFNYYEPNRFYRYLNTNSRLYSIHKSNRFEYKDKPATILNDVRIGERVSIVFLNSVSFVPENLLNKPEINNIPEMFITFSTIKHNLIKEFDKNYKDYKIQDSGSWTVVSGTKFK